MVATAPLTAFDADPAACSWQENWSFSFGDRTIATESRTIIYDPAQGVRMSRDPLKNAEMKVGLNLYSYVLNNPTNLVDPLGLFPNATEAQAMAAMQNPQNQTCAQAASTAYNWNNSMNPIFRGMFGVGQIGYGSFQMSSGASVLTGGTTATATIPLVGQILGPAAAIYGGMQVCSGANNARKGANNLWDALNGNGFSSLNLPMPQMPQQP